MTTRHAIGALVALAGAVGCGGVSKADTTSLVQIGYTVNVNTTAITGTAGFLEFQFNPGDETSRPITATIQRFSTSGGVISGTSSTIGTVTGSLPANVVFENTQARNDLLQGFTFGSSFGFEVLFTGTADAMSDTTATWSAFSMSLYDTGNDGSPGIQLFVADAISGAALIIDVPGMYPFGSSFISSSQVTVSMVPEIDPACLGSVLALVTGTLGLLERRRKTRC